VLLVLAKAGVEEALLAEAAEVHTNARVAPDADGERRRFLGIVLASRCAARTSVFVWHVHA
jgi:hypothetical protein